MSTREEHDNGMFAPAGEDSPNRLGSGDMSRVDEHPVTDTAVFNSRDTAPQRGPSSDYHHGQ